MNFLLYARKSTDTEERQVLSIDAQLAELRDFARKEHLHVLRELVESQTAKEPGRPVFNEMMHSIDTRQLSQAPPLPLPWPHYLPRVRLCHHIRHAEGTQLLPARQASRPLPTQVHPRGGPHVRTPHKRASCVVLRRTCALDARRHRPTGRV